MSLDSFGTDADVATLFNVVTFVPQPLWILMILSAAGVGPVKPIANAIMRPWGPTIAFSLCHVAIVVISATQPSGVAPIAEFNQVFDPTGFPFTTAPQAAMQHMMQYVNFVSEEWPHVLIWDLFVGRWIWLDGEKRGVFTPHSVLLTNLIGPPGLMLHFATCLITGKGLPPTTDEEAEALQGQCKLSFCSHHETLEGPSDGGLWHCAEGRSNLDPDAGSLVVRAAKARASSPASRRRRRPAAAAALR